MGSQMQMFVAYLWHSYQPVPEMPHISQHMIRKLNMYAQREGCSRLLQHGPFKAEALLMKHLLQQGLIYSLITSLRPSGGLY